MTGQRTYGALSIPIGLTLLQACQAPLEASATPENSAEPQIISGPCARISADPKPLPKQASPDYFQESFGGYWHREGDDRKSYDFGLLSPHKMIYRVSGLRGFGGIVPIEQVAIAPWTFSHSGGTAVVFMTHDCAELREMRNGVVTDEVIGVFVQKRR